MAWISLVLGIWLLAAPFALGTFPANNRLPLTNDLALGVLLVASSWWILAASAMPAIAAWFQMVCGAWLIVAPFALQHRTLSRAVADAVAVGIVVLVVSALELRGPLRAPVGAR
jgi:SPW repeat